MTTTEVIDREGEHAREERLFEDVQASIQAALMDGVTPEAARVWAEEAVLSAFGETGDPGVLSAILDLAS